jgi:hypothetical protein
MMRQDTSLAALMILNISFKDDTQAVFIAL